MSNPSPLPVSPVLRSWPWAAAVAAILFAVCIHYGDLSEPALCHGDEALTALRAESLLHEGRFWTPHWNGTVNLHKPPLYYWMVATVMCVTGPTELAVRLPSVLAFLALLILAYRLGARGAGRAGGIVSCLLLAACPLLAEQSRLGMMDTLVMLLFFGSAAALWAGGERPRMLYAWGVFCGLALLAKGGGAILPLVVGLVYLACTRRTAFRSPQLYAALGIALLLPGVWFLSQYLMHRQDFIDTYITWEVKYRLEGHSWWDTFCAQHTTRRLWQALGALGPACLVAGGALLAERTENARRARFWVVMAVVAMVLTNLIKQQMYWYVLPGLVSLLMILGHMLGSTVGARARALPVVLLAAALVGGTWLPQASGMPAALAWLARGSALIACIVALRRPARPRLAGAALLVAVAIAAWPGHTLVNDAVNLTRSKDGAGLKALALQVPPPAHRDDIPLVSDLRNYPMNVLMFYSGRRAVDASVLADVPSAPIVRYGVFKNSSHYTRYAHYRAQTVDNRGRYMLVRLEGSPAPAAQP